VQAFRKAIVVANPTSGSGRAARCLDEVAASLGGVAGQVQVVLTAQAGDGRRALQDLGEDNVLAVAVGGDGTFNEVLNGARLDACTLAVIPAGTGNVLAKELGMSRRVGRAVAQLLDGRVTLLDVATCNGRRFVSMFGAGVDARAVELVHECRKGGLTQLHYVPHVTRAALRPPSHRIEVEVDGRPFACGACQVSIGNTHSYGGPIEMTPAAAPDDGLLDVMCMRWDGPGQMAGMMVCGLLRSLHLSGAARYGRGRRVVVHAPGDRVPYEVDGDAAGVLPAAVEVQPAAVRLLVPRAYRPVQRRPEEDG